MNETSQDEEVDMDDILGAALDDLDDDDDNEDENVIKEEKIPESSKAANDVENKLPTEEELNNASEDGMSQLNSMMQELFKKAGSDDDPLGAVMQVLQQQVNEELKSIEKEEKNEAKGGVEKKAAKEKPETKKKKPVFGPEPPPKESDVDRTINKLLNDMTSASKEAPVPDFEEMMKGFDNLDAEGGDAIIDGMMQQLLTKELMYEPMKQVTEKFPQWLEEKKETLPKKEYEERCKQLEGLQALIRVYDTEPENTDKLIDLMKEVQEYGLPPTEIVTEIAPDLELDEDGAPKINPIQDCSIM
mmetsp:Transcript_12404/g.19206  ORF Transcript_12404/g.19206 Transcript_12404/m.19206 type:complete len:302 (+) Transcript_12404:75-980(+)